MDNQQEQTLHTVNPNLNSKTGGFAYSAAAIGFLAVTLIASLLITVLKVPSGSEVDAYVSFLCAPIGISAAIAVTLKVRKVRFKEICPVKCHPKYYALAALLIFGMMFCLTKINVVIDMFFNAIGYRVSLTQDALPEVAGWKILPAMIVIALLPAIVEELLFRGVILNNCENSMGSVRTIFITAFAFSLFHGSVEQTIYQFIAGMIFAAMAIRSRSILPGMIMHFLNNGLIVIFMACNLLNEQGNLAISQTADIVLTVLGALALIGGVVWLILDKTAVKKCQKGGVKDFFLYGLLAIAAFVLIWILSFALGMLPENIFG